MANNRTPFRQMFDEYNRNFGHDTDPEDMVEHIGNFLVAEKAAIRHAWMNYHDAEDPEQAFEEYFKATYGENR